MRRMTRREFLAASAVAGMGLALPLQAAPALAKKKARRKAAALAAAAAKPRGPLTPFVDPLPKPGTFTGTSLSMTQFAQQLHRDLPPTEVWGYGGSYPGPTIEAVKGTPKTLTYVNNLPASHLFKVDPTIIQMRGKGAKDTRTLTHLHGGHISDVADGNPHASPDVMVGQSQTVTYANDQDATHLWYHEHAMGITRLNVLAGLAGLYMLPVVPLAKGTTGRAGWASHSETTRCRW